MTTPTAQQYLSAFRTYLGVTENPLGSNRTIIGVEFGWNGVAWCAETTSVVAQKAGFGRRFWSASTDIWEANARAGVEGARWMVKEITPIPGDLPIWDYKRDGTANHISAIESVRADGMFITLGGNESNRCQRAVRSRYGLRGFIRLPYRILATPTPPPTTTPIPVTKAGLMLKIVWFKGEPTAAGNQEDVSAAYEVLYAASAVDKSVQVAVQAVWINSVADLNARRYSMGGMENQKRVDPKILRDAGVPFYGGPYKTQ